ncbi:hypothetical protein ACIB24_04040 [Spongisporangium articulatum]|uniref:Uncharacterized protein n=1 Tax=Spongisporangium articulatum TaxID=3362603 RepID=A0ABW8AIN7_9ACTN
MSRTARPAVVTSVAAAVALSALLSGLLAGCGGGSSAAGPSAPALVAGATCPTSAQFVDLTGSALAGQGTPTVTSTACAGRWAAARFELKEGLEGRVALQWSGSSWTTVLVDGADGTCPKTVRTAPEKVRGVLGC